MVSGGTLSSPLILQRSGIGNSKKLQKVGVKPLVDLPGVGLNFQDHYLTFATYRAKPGTSSNQLSNLGIITDGYRYREF